MAIQIGENFQKFVDFAKSIDTTANSIANASIQLGKLSVLEHSGDGIGMFAAIKRTAGHQKINNDTRALFKTAVLEMFGGSESNIPAPVKRAMQLGNFNNTGKPLSARRILAVMTAIENLNAAEAAKSKNGAAGGAGVIAAALKGRAMMKSATVDKTQQAHAAEDSKPVKMTSSTARKMIDASAKLLGFGDISSDSKKTLAGFLRQYGDKMPAKNARAFSNFLVTCSMTDGLDVDNLEHFAKEIRTWKDFDFGDPNLVDMGKKFVQRQNTYIAKNLSKPHMYMENNPDIFNSLYGDAERGVWRIGSKTYPVGTSKDTILNDFCETVKNPNARKVISTLLNQSSLADVEALLSKSEALIGEANVPVPQGEFIHTIKGGDMFVSRDATRDGCGITRDSNVRYELDLSEDGKTATVTVTTEKDLSTNASRYTEYRFGKASVSQQITIDLTKPMPEVTNVTFAQTFTPDEVSK